MKRVIKLLLLVITLFNININVLAKNNTVDFNKLGSVEITLKSSDEGNVIKGAEISLYKVADLSEENNHFVYDYTESFNKCDASLTNLEDKDLTNNILKCFNDNINGIKKITNETGTTKFNNLSLGLYLVKETNTVEGFSNFEPYLIMIPKNINNKYVYDITSKPKSEIIKTSDYTVKKIWNTKNSNVSNTSIPESIEVVLLKEDKEISKVVLNKSNNWTYTWNNLPKSDNYKVEELNIPKGYTATYDKEGTTFIITNTSTLVQTGQNTWITVVTAFLGLTFITIAIYLKKNEKIK